ncbi:MAG TPA: hypothetical protein PKE21_08160 [Flavobacteriales bacterium]|nr:hypothetical protein [Flavobacteriales bacterium]HMR27434.1 hypothetical protein [Flavobacteriales bacterium]
MRTCSFTILVLTAVAGCAQGPAPKGNWFLYWGYNRSGYSGSDIHLEGPGYDVTFRHVKAHDRPSEPSAEYVQPSTFTYPQYNYRLGYFLRDRWSISLGLDHMKYVVDQDQVVRMDGTVAPDRSDAYSMDHDSRMVTLGPDLLKYEHTDGLNLLSLDVDHYDALWQAANGRHGLRVFEGLHAGALIPRSDVRVFGDGVNNVFHLAGFGVGAQVGLHLVLWKHLLVRTTGRAGWVDLPDVLTTGEAGERASQHFWFWQANLTVGVQFALGGRKADRSSAAP